MRARWILDPRLVCVLAIVAERLVAIRSVVADSAFAAVYGSVSPCLSTSELVAEMAIDHRGIAAVTAGQIQADRLSVLVLVSSHVIPFSGGGEK